MIIFHKMVILIWFGQNLNPNKFDADSTLVKSDRSSLQGMEMTASLQKCRRTVLTLSLKLTQTGAIPHRLRALHEGPDTIEGLLDRHLVKKAKVSGKDDDENDILTRQRLTSTRRGALSLYRDILRATTFFTWADNQGVLWQDVMSSDINDTI
ncbi:hypothetical protein Ancab_035380 [Ancistrocladus abbreviatus]